MDDLAEFIFDIIGAIIDGAFDGRKKVKKPNDNSINLIETYNQESYIPGLIATAIAVSYVDDHKLDRNESEMINQLFKRNFYDLTKKAKKNIKYIRRHKINIEKLTKIYDKLNIDYYMMQRITNDLENVIKYSNQGDSKKLYLINNIREHNSTNRKL